MAGNPPDSLASLTESVFSRRAHGIKPGLDPIRALMRHLGNSESKFPSVHVAGTNGKGSVSAMLEALLRADGLRTGLFTSPHILRFNERFRVGGKCIDDQSLSELLLHVEQACGAVEKPDRPITFFEFSTAMAFLHFACRDVEAAVIETGLGGRLDSTNIADSVVSVITSVSLDHTEFLGETLPEIAFEKAGIIKQGRTVVCGSLPPDALQVIEHTARLRGCRLLSLERDVTVHLKKARGGRSPRVMIETSSNSYGPFSVPLLGRHQIENCALAVLAAETFMTHLGRELDAKNVITGIESAQWPGRSQCLRQNPTVLLDAAHNPNGVDAIMKLMQEQYPNAKCGLITGMLLDKDIEGMIDIFAAGVSECWTVPVANHRAAPPAELAARFQNCGIPSQAVSLPEAWQSSIEWAQNNRGVVLIAGSLFLASDVFKYMADTGLAESTELFI